MATSLEALAAQVLQLSMQDRSRLLERLITNLDSAAEAEAQWDAISDERETELESGTVAPVQFDIAIARLESRFVK